LKETRPSLSEKEGRGNPEISGRIGVWRIGVNTAGTLKKRTIGIGELATLGVTGGLDTKNTGQDIKSPLWGSNLRPGPRYMLSAIDLLACQKK